MGKVNRIFNNVEPKSEEIQTKLTNSEARDYLSPADLQNVIPSVVEETTKNLEKVGRNN
jgi:hypothetical protein